MICKCPCCKADLEATAQIEKKNIVHRDGSLEIKISMAGLELKPKNSIFLLVHAL